MSTRNWFCTWLKVLFLMWVTIAATLPVAAAPRKPFKCAYNCCPPTGCSGARWYANMQTNHANVMNIANGGYIPPASLLYADALAIRMYVYAAEGNGFMQQAEAFWTKIVNNGQFMNTTLNAQQISQVSKAFGGLVPEATIQAMMNGITTADRQKTISLVSSKGGLAGFYLYIAYVIEVAAEKEKRRERDGYNPFDPFHLRPHLKPNNPVAGVIADAELAAGAIIGGLAFVALLPEEVVAVGVGCGIAGALTVLGNDVGIWDSWGGGYQFQEGDQT